MILFLMVYIFKYFLLLVPLNNGSLRECNNGIILNLIVFYLNWNKYINLYKY
jgi:hypothetical protein